MAHQPTRVCSHCGKVLGNHRLDLERRVERVTVSQQCDEVVITIEVAWADDVEAYCDHICWQAAEPRLAEALRVRSTYPPFNFVSSCCRCGASVDRMKPHVCYPICDMIYSEAQPRVADCVEERDWLVLCLECESPTKGIAMARLVDEPASELECC